VSGQFDRAGFRQAVIDRWCGKQHSTERHGLVVVPEFRAGGMTDALLEIAADVAFQVGDKAWDEGYDEGHHDGRYEGLRDGHDDGYSAGYDNGRSDALEDM
jgi:hypothetical protein